MRPTALIRSLLVLRLIRQATKQQEQYVRLQLQEASVKLLEVEDREMDIRVRFLDHGFEQEVCYPRVTLLAEAEALTTLWKHWSYSR
ncbi:MAG: hypothetical protein IMW91_01185 [Firmicutes bacterium]|nr:hypothetical protein [Bacillota bacterium]